jgi:putative integral membrane protein (TIGR02587 family)
MSAAPARARQGSFWTDIGRAAGGAIFFSLPLLMTMEMWELGFHIERGPLVLFMLLMFPMLVGLDRVSGFKDANLWIEDVADALIAYAVGFVTSAIVLAFLDIIETGMALREVVGKVALQSVPASFGAVIASSQLWGASEGEERERKEGGYFTELFLMSAGAVFFAFNVAPTEEMVIIAFRLSAWETLALLLATIAAMHLFVHSVNFAGSSRKSRGAPAWSYVLRFAMPGYVLSLLVSAYVLWTFGRFDGLAPAMMVREAIVLAFPAGLGAAAARLVI